MSNQDYLLVPVKIKALVVNPEIRQFQNFRRWTRNYSNLSRFNSPEPDPFGGGEDDFSTQAQNEGVYVQWELPMGLRHGNQKESGEIDFFLVPNRWLVVRFSGAVEERMATAWVVESDYLNPSRSGEPPIPVPVPYWDPAVGYDPENPVAGKTLLGRSLSLNSPSQWKETNQRALFLKAIGYGDVSFASYQPGCNNVFSFFDPLSGITEDTLSYFVTGWYSDETADCMSGWKTSEDFSDLLNKMSWNIPGNDTGNGPTDTTTQSLYHGFVYGISWDVKGGNLFPVDDKLNPSVAVGNNAVDALTALIKAQNAGQTPVVNTTLLEAFQYNMLHYLDEPNGTDTLDQKIREAWFGSLPGGTSWEVVNNPDVDPAQIRLSVQYLAKEAAWLAQLNTDQQNLDMQTRALCTMQETLFATWYKYYRLKNMFDPPDDKDSLLPAYAADLDPSGAGGLYQKVKSQQDLVTQLGAKAPDVSGLDKSRILKQVPNPRYWQMNDPVVLISGTQNSNGKGASLVLNCRFSNNTINGFTYKVGGKGAQTIIGLDQVSKVIPMLSLENLPVPIGALWNEYFLLDPSNAAAIVLAVLSTHDAGVVADLGAQMAGCQQYNGTVPDLVPSSWQQPWEPIFMEWTVNYYPIPYKGDDYQWDFDGKDYNWNGKGTAGPYVAISGRTFLTPQSQFSYKARLQQFLNDNTNQGLDDLQEFIASMDQWDFLSQTLTGFHDQLRKLNPLPNVHPPADSPLNPLIGDNYKNVPDPDSDVVFDGVRAGQFFFAELKVYDSFGQALEIIENTAHGGTRASGIYEVMIADTLTPTQLVNSQSKYYVQLPPRLLQAGQLGFDFVDDNPVCAWLLPDHLDNSLFAYDANGQALGEIRVVVSGGGSSVNYLPAPGSVVTDLAGLSQVNIHLGYMFQSLCGLDAGSFNDFMKVIDSTLWTIDPLGARSDNYFSLLMGRPLALVRSKLQFSLYGDAIRDTAWDGDDPEFVNYLFSVKLGSQGNRMDGLIGYYSGSSAADYASFNCVHDLKDLDLTDQTYIRTIGEGNYLNLAFNDNSNVYLSMLVDPRAQVYAETGILPLVSLQLPDSFLAGALKNMAVSFNAGPALTALASVNDVVSVVYPQPSEQKQSWQWVEQTLDKNSNPGWNYYPLTSPGQTASLPDVANTIRDGYLRLNINNTE